MAKQSIRQSLGQLEPFPAEGQISDPVVRSDRCASSSHHLEAAVEHERMNIEPAPVDGVWQGYLAQRLARPGPECLQRAEGGAEIYPDVSLGTVVSREIHRLKIGLQPCRVQGRAGL